jgi:hypothetical protein
VIQYIFLRDHVADLTHSPDKTEEVRRLGMGRLLGDLSSKMHQKIDLGEKEPLKLLVHSTHDTALAALASTLDVYDEKWGLLRFFFLAHSLVQMASLHCKHHLRTVPQSARLCISLYAARRAIKYQDQTYQF